MPFKGSKHDTHIFKQQGAVLFLQLPKTAEFRNHRNNWQSSLSTTSFHSMSNQ